MLNRRQQFGKESEAIAVKHLRKNGYRILEKNYRTKLGEIDIIAKDGRTLVFVEVKARKNRHYGNPKAAVTFKKQYKISKTALCYLKSTRQTNAKARFDVVTIYLQDSNPEVEIIKNAFDLAYK